MDNLKISIRALRTNRGRTQMECAKVLGISTMSYREKEKDISRWKFVEIVKLADFLGYPIEVFR